MSITVGIKSIGKTFIYSLILCTVYLAYFLLFKVNNLSFADLLILFTSIIIVAISLCNLVDNGIRANNLFFLLFFGTMFLNQIDISNYQMPKSLEHYYYFTLGPLLFGSILGYAEKKSDIKRDNNRSAIHGVNTIWPYLLLLYILLEVYMLSRTGIRIFTGLLFSGDESKFVVQGLSGIGYVLAYALLCLSYSLPNKKKFLVVGILILFQGILAGHRGEIMRILLFTFIGYGVELGKKILDKKNCRKIVLAFLCILILFVLAGQYRQNTIYSVANVTTRFSISTKIKSRIDNTFVSWVYAYTGFNFEVLKNSIDMMPDRKLGLHLIILPIARIIYGSNVPGLYNAKLDFGDYGGINAATFLKPYIYDMGSLYFVEIVLASLLYSYILKSCKYKYMGSYIFLLMLISLTLFGDYMFSVNRFYGLLVGIACEYMNKRIVIKRNSQ